MSNTAVNEKIRLILPLLTKFQSVTEEQVHQRERLGDALAFKAVVSRMMEFVRMLRLIDAEWLSGLPASLLDRLRDSLRGVDTEYAQVLDFSPASGGAIVEIRDERERKLATALQQSMGQIYPIVAYLRSSRLDPESASAAISSYFEERRAEFEGVRSEVLAKANNVEKLVEATKFASAQEAASAQSSYFLQEAEIHRKLANKWQLGVLVAAIAFAAYGGLLLGGALLSWFPSDSLGATVQMISAKVVVFFVLAYLLVMCARNANAHRNVWAQNSHRHRALQTYEAFARAAKFDGARDLILGHAAACMYLPQDTGFIRGESSGSASAAADAIAAIQRVAARAAAGSNQ